GNTWSADDLDVERLPILGIALSQLHALKRPSQSLDLRQWAESYCRGLDEPKLTVAKAWFEQMDGLLSELASSQSCLCHNDLVAENMIYGRKLIFVDWEYAMANDPYFDLAVVCAHHSLDETASRVLLESYCGLADPATRQRLATWQQVYLRLYGLWLMATQGAQGVSKIAELQARLE
ncbi:MAG: phosphotransferase, partial [Pseudomonadota bacterium]